MSSATYSVRIDNDLKHQAEAIYSAMGQTLSSAINAFLLQSVREGGFPFQMQLSQSERDTILAKLEADALISDTNYIAYDVEDALQELKR